MLTTMTEEDWTIVLKRYSKGHLAHGAAAMWTERDRRFSKPCSISWFTTSAWRVCRKSLGIGTAAGSGSGARSRSGTFEAFFDALAATSEMAHLVQMFDSAIVRAHVSAAGAKGAKSAWSGARSLAWRLLDQDSLEDRFRWLANCLSSHRW